MNEPRVEQCHGWRRFAVVLGVAALSGVAGFFGGTTIGDWVEPDDGLILVRGGAIIVYGIMGAVFLALVGAVAAWWGTRAGVN